MAKKRRQLEQGQNEKNQTDVVSDEGDHDQDLSNIPSPSASAFAIVTRPEPNKEVAQRPWSEDDEVSLLNGLCHFVSDPISDPDGFYEFVKPMLSVEVSRNQVIDKVKRLKKKYRRKLDKGGAGNLSNHSKVKAFELSNKIWGATKKVEKPEKEILGKEKPWKDEAEKDKPEEDKPKKDKPKKDQPEKHKPEKQKPQMEKPGKDEPETGNCGGVVLGLGCSGFVASSDGNSNRRVAGAGKRRKAVVVEINGAGMEEGRKNDELVFQHKEDKGKIGCLGEWLVEQERKGLFGEGVRQVLEEGLRRVEKGKMGEWEERWRELKKEELGLFVRRQKLIEEQLRFVLDILESEN